MDGQNFDNGQNNQQSDQSNNYQDYTANVQYQAPPENHDEPKSTNGCQIASLVLGILGILGCCCYGIVGFVLGLIGLILAIVGNKKSKGSGVGIAGLICSIIALILGAIGTVYYAMIFIGMTGAGPFAELMYEMGYYDYFNNF